jgi:UDPglucose 6-dehydrogenase
LEAYIRIAEKMGYDFKLLKAVKEINDAQRRILVQKIERHLWNVKGKKIAMLGLAFKPDTDDLRFAPALEVVDLLLEKGAKIHAYDPQAMAGAKDLLGSKISYAKDPYAAAKGADCLLLMTEWNEFKKVDFKKIKSIMRQPFVADARNMYDPKEMRRFGFRYVGMGRGRAE